MIVVAQNRRLFLGHFTQLIVYSWKRVNSVDFKVWQKTESDGADCTLGGNRSRRRNESYGAAWGALKMREWKMQEWKKQER